LAVTCAAASVGLIPGEDRAEISVTAEPGLARAMDELNWLVTHRPAIPEYARCRALTLAKLAMLSWRTERLAEAEDLFQQAFLAQRAVVADFPDLPSHNRVQMELIRLRWAQVCLARGENEDDRVRLGRARELLKTCVEQLIELTARPELVRDELAWTILPVAYQTLNDVDRKE